MKQLTKKFKNIEKTFEELKSFVEIKKISPFMEIATTAAAIVSEDDNVYFGVNIKTDCGLGFCAERNAISTMLTCGETRIKYIICVDRTLSPRLPCGACREFIPQVDPKNLNSQVITSVSPQNTTKIKDLLPEWWGHEKIGRKINK